MSAINAKKKSRQYFHDYLKYGFVPSIDDTIPLCFLCQKTLSNVAMKLAKIKDHFGKDPFY